MYNLFDAGGIQRVVSVLASEFAQNHDVVIQCYDKPVDENRSRYDLSGKVKIIFSKDNRYQYGLRKLLRRLNQKTAALEKKDMKKLTEFAYLLPSQQKEYKRIIEENAIDVAIAVGPYESCILGSIAKQLHCTTIGWQHSSYRAYFETPGYGCWGIRHLFDCCIRQLDHYVVLNEYDENEFKTKMGLLCQTIHNPKSFSTNELSDLSQKRFISAGRMIPLKMFDKLIEAFKCFARYNDDWNLYIYGEGETRNQLANLIEEYGLQNRVFLPGFSEDMIENLRASSCYLLSSKWEGMPMVVLEAMEMGIPTISFDISAMIPLIENGKEGILVPSFDVEKYAQAMLTIAGNKEIRVCMGNAAREKARNFSIDKIADDWMNLFSDKQGEVEL